MKELRDTTVKTFTERVRVVSPDDVLFRSDIHVARAPLFEAAGIRAASAVVEEVVVIVDDQMSDAEASVAIEDLVRDRSLEVMR